MPRAVAVYRELRCHSCSTHWRQHVWGYDEHWTQPREQLHCPNPDCLTPHIEVLPRWDRTGQYAQVRASQRAVVYMMPDGTSSAPASNRYDDEIAIAAVQAGGVRMEFPSVRALRQFQHDRAQYDGDELTDRNMVIDYDQSTILHGETLTRKRIQIEDERRARALERMDGMKVLMGGGYYEEFREQLERERGR